MNAVAFSPDGKHVVSGSSDLRVKIWDAATGAEVHLKLYWGALMVLGRLGDGGVLWFRFAYA